LVYLFIYSAQQQIAACTLFTHAPPLVTFSKPQKTLLKSAICDFCGMTVCCFWSRSMLERSHLYREIHEQPAALQAFLSYETQHIADLAGAINQRQIDTIVIAGRGTSDNAGRYAQYVLGSLNSKLVALAAPSLYSIYHQPPKFGNALVIGISQSGKSPDIVGVVAEAKRQGALTAAITNVPSSDLAQHADHVIRLHTGEEHAIAATKTYTSQLLAIAVLSAALATDNQEEMQAALRRLPGAVAQALTLNPTIRMFAQRYRYMRDCVVIGRGYNYATAYELALKLKELTYTIAEPYSSADFMHGPMAMLEYGFPAIVFAPSGRVLPELHHFIDVLRQREAETIIISDDDETLKLARIPFKLPVSMPEWLSPITAIVPGQLFAMHLAVARDYDPDHPRGLRKVTETK
jgi:glucosamine--fructose-6-phosphate aminotransferase (isomerizing)